MTIYDQIALKIIKEQELLMGPVAWLQAGKVKGLHVDGTKSAEIESGSDGTNVVNDLVGRYESLFGRAGREMCKEAASALVADLQPSQVPVSLK